MLKDFMQAGRIIGPEGIPIPNGAGANPVEQAPSLPVAISLREPDAEALAQLEVDPLVVSEFDADHAWAEGLVDHATQLYNGRGLARRVRELGAEARRRSAPLACVAFSVDAADANGASAERVARTLRETGRTSDALGRIGPREFAVIAPETGADAALRLAQRLSRVLTGRSSRGMGVAPAEFVAGYDAVADAAVAKFDPTTLLAHASAALAAAARDPTAGRIRRFENGVRPT